MGMLRLWLATIVLLSHAAPSAAGQHLCGSLAVSAFYVVSGFVIQLLMAKPEAGGAGWITGFYVSRALRIFPLYYLFSILSLPFVHADNATLQSTIATHNIGTLAFLGFENLFIFGQDVGRFLSVDLPGGNLVPQPTYSPDVLHASSLPVLGQSWSLAVEFGFYLVAPFLLKRSTMWVVAVVAASLCVRFVTGSLFGDGHFNEWWNAFLPSEIGTFLIGALAYRAYAGGICQIGTRRHALAFGAAIVVWSFGYNYFQATAAALTYGSFVVLIAVALPFLAAATAKSQVDRFIGELSYPIYIGHMLALTLVSQFVVGEAWRAAITWLVAVAVSIPLVWYFEEPFASVRRSIAARIASRGENHIRSPGRPAGLPVAERKIRGG